jgi:hypothetical protein
VQETFGQALRRGRETRAEQCSFFNLSHDVFGIVEINALKTEFTDSDVRKISDTSGSRTTVMASVLRAVAKRFGRALR